MPYRLATPQRLHAIGEKMGWVVGFEPTASRATIWRSNQLNYTHHTRMARLKGFEPPTHGLEGRCSIQLSYRRIRPQTSVEVNLERSSLLTRLDFSIFSRICQAFFKKTIRRPICDARSPHTQEKACRP